LLQCDTIVTCHQAAVSQEVGTTIMEVADLSKMILVARVDETSVSQVKVGQKAKVRAQAYPGEDPMTLPTAEAVAETIVPMCLPSYTETGKIYDYRAGRLNSFRPPA